MIGSVLPNATNVGPQAVWSTFRRSTSAARRCINIRYGANPLENTGAYRPLQSKIPTATKQPHNLDGNSAGNIEDSAESVRLVESDIRQIRAHSNAWSTNLAERRIETERLVEECKAGKASEALR